MYDGGDLLTTGDDQTIIEYIFHRYEAEALRNLTDSQITYRLTWQYGKETDAVWKNSDELTRLYMQSHPTELTKYAVHRICNMIHCLFDYLPKLTTGAYSDVPMEPKELRSINSGMTNLLNFIPNSVNKIKRDISFESKISGGDYFDIKVIERVLSNIFNTYTDEHRDLDTDHAKHHFGVKRHEVLNANVYCNFSKLFDLLKKFVLTKLPNVLSCLYNVKSINDNRNVLSILASVASVFMQLRIPLNMHPNKLDRLYEKYIKRLDPTIEAIQVARQYSGFNLLEVVGAEPCILSGSQYVTDPLTRNNFYHEEPAELSSKTEIKEDSLAERLLVTQILACGPLDSYQ